MKIINNQDALLIDEIKYLTNEKSNIYISCNYFTSFAVFELIDILKEANKVEVLLDFKFQDEDDFKFIQNDNEKQLNLKLDRKYKINQVIGLIENKIEFRNGGIGNQNIIVVENEGVSTCFTLTPMNLDSVSLGVLPSEMPIFINSFEDSDNQYLNLFQNKALTKLSALPNSKKRIINLSMLTQLTH